MLASRTAGSDAAAWCGTPCTRASSSRTRCAGDSECTACGARRRAASWCRDRDRTRAARVRQAREPRAPARHRAGMATHARVLGVSASQDPAGLRVIEPCHAAGQRAPALEVVARTLVLAVTRDADLRADVRLRVKTALQHRIVAARARRIARRSGDRPGCRRTTRGSCRATPATTAARTPSRRAASRRPASAREDTSQPPPRFQLCVFCASSTGTRRE